MENSKKVIAAAKQVFDQLREIDSETLKDLLKTRQKGDVYKSLTEIYHFNDCEEGNYRCCMERNKIVIGLTCSGQENNLRSSVNDCYEGMIDQPLWALVA